MLEQTQLDDAVPGDTRTPAALPHPWPASLARSARARAVELSAGQVVLREGDRSDVLYLLELGLVKVTRTTHQGTQLVLGVLGPGEVLGELSVIDTGARSASVEALTPVRLRAIPGDVLIEQYEEQPEVRVWLLTVVARRLRRAGGVSTDLVFTSVVQRVATVLLDLARQLGQDHAGSTKVVHGLTQSELAQLVGTTRESANRALVAFARRGWIRSGVKSFVLHDPPALRQVSQNPQARLEALDADADHGR